MKLRLLKLALCAMALLPMGAWADDVTWNFTSWLDATITNLNADATNWTISDKNGESTTDARWKLQISGGSAQALSANSTAIAEFSGLTFTWPSAANRIIIDNRSTSKRLTMASHQEKVHVPVSVGKKVTITSRTNGEDANRMICSDAGVAVYQQTAAGTAQRTDVFIITSAFSGTSAAFYGETSGKAYNIFSITVADATAAELAEVENVPTVTTKWNFDQYMGVSANQFGGSSTGVAIFNGLYIHNNGAHAFKDKKGKDVMALFNSAATSSIPTLTGKGANETVSLDAFAFTAGCAGTVSVTGYASEARTIKIYVNGVEAKSESYVAKAHKATTYDVSKYDVVYIIPQDGAFYFEEISFVPTTATAMTKDITIPTVGWATFSATQNYKWTSEDLKAYYVSSTTSGVAHLEEIAKNDGIPACTGVLLYKDGGGDITLTSAESATAIGTNYLKANLAAYTIAAVTGVTNYVLVKKSNSDKVEFVKVGETSAALGAGKSYLQIVTPSSPAPAFYSIGLDNNSVTGISQPVVKDVEDGAYYNLMGQRVDHPTKGIYIHNGKKIYVK